MGFTSTQNRASQQSTRVAGNIALVSGLFGASAGTGHISLPGTAIIAYGVNVNKFHSVGTAHVMTKPDVEGANRGSAGTIGFLDIPVHLDGDFWAIIQI